MLFLLSRDHGRPAQALRKSAIKSEKPLWNVRDNPCPPSKTHATNATLNSLSKALNNGHPKPYSQSHAYLPAGYTAKDLGKRGGSAQAASSRLLYRVIQRVRELQTIAAKNAAETAEKMARELNEIQYEARADKAHAAAVAAVLGKAKVLNIVDCPNTQQIDFKQARSMTDVGRKLLQSVGFREPDDA